MVAPAGYNAVPDAFHGLLQHCQGFGRLGAGMELAVVQQVLSRAPIGDRLGITTFAPAMIPSSLPRGAIVPRAVVAGSRTSGSIRRIIAKSLRVNSIDPAGSERNGVSLCGINGPMPTI